MNAARFAMLAAVLLLAPVAARADAEPPPEGAFTLVVLPDTQTYAQMRNLNRIFLAQTQWIAEHRESHDIRFVLHVGDVVQSNIAVEWDVAKQAFIALDEAVVPYAISPGNHDYGPGGGAQNRQTLFNDYFGPDSGYGKQPTVGGFFEPGRSDSSFHTFSAGGRDWIVIALEWGPRDTVVEWADQVLLDHPDHRGIVITHAYMYSDDTRYDFRTRGAGQSWNPHTYGTANDPGGTNDGEELWEKLVSKHDIAFVFSGHVLNDGTGRLMSVGESGQVVHQLLANYQSGVAGSVNGGNGFLRLVQVLPEEDIVQIRTYSPFIDEYKTEPDQEFSLALCDVPSDPELNVNACDIVAAFSVEPDVGDVPLEVRLDASASSTRVGRMIESFEWDLGDGTTTTGPVVTHEYVQGGAHLVRLRVTDDRGLSATAERTVRVSCPSEGVSPWSAVDIGEVLLPGGTSFESGNGEGCLAICATGRLLAGGDDDFRFVHQRVSGDADLSARITRVDGSAPGAQVGVMLREELEPDARFFAMTLRRTRTSTRARFQHRDAEGGSMRSKAVAPDAELPSFWVKIERRGDEGIGYVSADGTRWEEVQRRVIPGFAGTIYAGIVAIGNEPGERESFDPLNAGVCEVELIGVEAAPEFRRGDANASGAVTVADAVVTLDLLTGREAPCVDAADSNDDGRVGISDATYTLNYLFLSGAAIPAPGPGACGVDGTPDEIGCESYAGCRG